MCKTFCFGCLKINSFGVVIGPNKQSLKKIIFYGGVVLGLGFEE
jgi:hypothetical protein